MLAGSGRVVRIDCRKNENYPMDLRSLRELVDSVVSDEIAETCIVESRLMDGCADIEFAIWADGVLLVKFFIGPESAIDRADEVVMQLRKEIVEILRDRDCGVTVMLSSLLEERDASLPLDPEH